MTNKISLITYRIFITMTTMVVQRKNEYLNCNNCNGILVVIVSLSKYKPL